MPVDKPVDPAANPISVYAAEIRGIDHASLRHYTDQRELISFRSLPEKSSKVNLLAGDPEKWVSIAETPYFGV